jgi:hypothetical protein
MIPVYVALYGPKGLVIFARITPILRGWELAGGVGGRFQIVRF